MSKAPVPAPKCNHHTYAVAERHGEAASLVLVLRGWVKDPVWYSVKCLPFLYRGLCKNLMTHLPRPTAKPVSPFSTYKW